MDNVKVSRADLLQKLTANRADHRGVFLEAQKKYRQAVIDRLDAMLADARAGKRFAQSVGLVAPQDHTSDYDRVIAMLEMSVDDTIDLTAQSFQAYVMDQWHWARQFGVSAMSYGVRNKYSVSEPDDEDE